MSNYPVQSTLAPIRFEPYGVLSPASDYSVGWGPPSEETSEAEPELGPEETRDEEPRIRHEIEALREFWIADISLDADEPRSSVERHVQVLRGLSKTMFVPFLMQALGITAETHEDPWLTSALDELEEVGELRDNWDGEGSPAVSDELLRTVADALCRLKANPGRAYPRPAIVPVPGGKVQLEWRKADRYFEIEFLGGGIARCIDKEGAHIQVKRIGVPEIADLSKIVEQMFA